jgi:hypothetical protein
MLTIRWSKAHESRRPFAKASDMRTIIRSLLGAPFLLPSIAFASQGPGAGLGTASPDLQAFTFTIVIFPLVAVLVFATARVIGFWEGPSED